MSVIKVQPSIHDGVVSHGNKSPTQEMPATDLPQIEILSRRGSPEVAEIFVSRLRHGDDNSLVEFVDGLDFRFPREEKWIINISTQFGCPVGCVFCDAAHRYFGNIDAPGMLAQIDAVLRRHPGVARECKKLKVHFSRMGEPSRNPDVLEAIARLPSLVRSSGLWVCVASVAPRGCEDWFDALLRLRDRLFPGRMQLQFSINSTSETYRAHLTPTPLMPFSWIRENAARFHGPGQRSCVLNFALARDIPFEPVTLRQQFDPATTCVKLTPLNPTGAGDRNNLSSLSQPQLLDIAEEVRSHGFDVILSIGDPREDLIGSNCGQSVRAMRRSDET
ncbi:MAG TPA: hypothetical protein PLY68_06355 [Myxococcota bacterium]|nr:hypothetical protein [Myxococcota bacterium]HNZ02857.1 hypothetical protein [Myxococcota bacterium]HPB50718.1 hypothetical protein [Myxococcota bacterium]HQP95804.1 hypothetical protein [Myxococcota bacterium]